ncbi:ATP-dependent DNA helicase DinG [Polynucleobacter sp. 30F-ANTBAC]|uniref:ATP-dependent DNA helicase DinG n=1 Tax=Polynucleobacter sp. 30F-ANTBAC TaxID=2689095 RepID=UPI001C0AEA22|nr:ATP-dependent DNA helicase DinG [Polynucleobacter sp. 30F-ANTBAC]
MSRAELKEIQAKIQEFYEAVQHSWPGFKPRLGQEQMFEEITQTLNLAKDPKDDRQGDNLLVIEGKTGVGKTLGYLIPAIIFSKLLQRRVIISTATIALQEQLMNKDLPALSKISPVEFHYGLAKGRGRYVCNIRLEQISGKTKQSALFEDANWDGPPKEQDKDRFADALIALNDGSWNGEKDTAPSEVTDTMWSRIAAERSSCLGRHCQRFNVCPYFNARRDLVKADVIIANHDLVISTIASGSKILPDATETLYVFDEAHNLPSVGIKHFASSVGLIASTRWLEKIMAAVLRADALLPDSSGNIAEEVHEIVESLIMHTREMINSLRMANLVSHDNTIQRFKNGELSQEFISYAEVIGPLAIGLNNRVAKILQQLNDQRNNSIDKESFSPSILEIGSYQSKTENLSNTWHLMQAEADPPIAKWLEWQDLGASFDFKLHASPISAAQNLAQTLWTKSSAAILTSATLRTMGDFQYFLRQTGLNWFPKTRTFEAESPFNYEEQGIFSVPDMLECPSANAEGHTQELSEAIPRELTDLKHGALVLFTSKKQMKQVYENLPDDFLKDVLMQGDQTRSKLIANHEKRIENNQRSILFGMQSFGEGMDLPGKLCEVVVITKLPFAPPDSPVEEAKAEWLEKNQGNPFYEISVPAVALKLQQWVGRGIRTETDKAKIVVLDKRLKTKPYGKKLIAGLPPFKRLM